MIENYLLGEKQQNVLCLSEPLPNTIHLKNRGCFQPIVCSQRDKPSLWVELTQKMFIFHQTRG